MSSKEELLDKAHRLRELPERITEALGRAFETDNYEEVERLIQEYRSAKKDIKLAFIDRPVESIPESENKDDRRVLQNVLLNNKLRFERSVAGTPLEKVLRDELSVDEMDDLAEDYFTRGYSYAKSLYHAGALIASVGELPDNLSPVLQEVRECYALERYLAVCTLCRTVLEISVDDIYAAEGLNNDLSDNYIYVKNNIQEGQRRQVSKILDSDETYPEYFDPSLFDQITMLCVLPKYKNLRGTLHNLRDKMNSLVHRGGIPGRKRAKKFLTDTLQVVHQLYELSDSKA